MDIKLRVLILEDNEADARFLREELVEGGIDPIVDYVVDRDGFLQQLDRKPDVILADIRMPTFGAEDALNLLNEQRIDIPVIVVSGVSDDVGARRFLDMGASDYLLKDRLARLAPAVIRAVYERRMREQFESDLAQSNLRFEAIWKNSIDALRLTDQNGTIIEVNDSFCKLVGMQREELVGRPFSVAYPLESRDLVLENYNKLFKEGGAVTGFRQERRLRFASGRECDLDISISPIEWQAGDLWLLAILRDISERKQLEAQFLRSQRLESVGAFAGSIVHDFNNILAPIMMAGSLLRDSPDPADSEKAFSIIEDSTRRGSELVRKILLFSRGIDGEKKAMDPRHLIEEMFRFVSTTFPRNIQFNGKIHDSLWEIVGDSTQLYQVLLNLSVNARDAMPEGGTLLMEAKNVRIQNEVPNAYPATSLGSFVQIAIEDTGCGIEVETHKTLFDPLYSTKAEGKGSGLGLPTSMRIVLSHGGFLAIRSAPGEGARFEVYIPAMGKHAMRDTSRAGPETGQTFPEPQRGAGETILVVDDESAIRNLASKILKKEGYSPISASDGQEALSILENDDPPIRLVLTDVAMPRMDGVEFVRRLRAAGFANPVIAMSGNLNDKAAENLRKAGVHSILEKPFSGSKLLNVLHEVLQFGDARR